MFDNYVLLKSNNLKNQVVGLRYLMWGPMKNIKNMSSVIYHFANSLNILIILKFLTNLMAKAGEQKRDFIHVDDVISVNLVYE